MVACPFINIAQPKSSECIHRDTPVQRLWLGPRPRDSVTFRISFTGAIVDKPKAGTTIMTDERYFFFDKRYLGGTWGHSLFGVLGTGYFAPIMSCGEIETEKPLKRPKQSVSHRNFKTLAHMNLSPCTKKGPEQNMPGALWSPRLRARCASYLRLPPPSPGRRELPPRLPPRLLP